MKKSSSEKKLIATVVPTPEELDNSEETLPTLNDGYGDQINIVVPIRDDLNQIILAGLEDDLRWNKAIVENGCANDAPSWTKIVKKASMIILATKKKIAEIKAKMKEGE